MPYLIRNVFKENRIAFRFKSKYYLLNDYLKIILSHLLAFSEPSYYVMFDFMKILRIERKTRKNIKEFFFIYLILKKNFEKKIIRIIIC